MISLYSQNLSAISILYYFHSCFKVLAALWRLLNHKYANLRSLKSSAILWFHFDSMIFCINACNNLLFICSLWKTKAFSKHSFSWAFCCWSYKSFNFLSSSSFHLISFASCFYYFSSSIFFHFSSSCFNILSHSFSSFLFSIASFHSLYFLSLSSLYLSYFDFETPQVLV